MKLKDLLPVGSVVLLKHARKKIVIMGILQIKASPQDPASTYDYMGVPFPEGYMGRESCLLFNHQDIEEVIFSGYVNEERNIFISAIQSLIDGTDKALSDLKG